MICGILPVKAPGESKQRLGELLTAAERAELACLMFDIAFRELMVARGLNRVVVASSDEEVLSRAAAGGASVIRESSQSGHSSSADAAVRHCMAEGATTVLLMPIDVPLVRAYEIEALLQMALSLEPPRLVIVPSADGTGTNAMVRTPPDLIESRFGPNSFAAHVERARERGATVHVTRPRGLVFDLDTPEDVATYLALSPAGALADFLRPVAVAARTNTAVSDR